MDVIVKQVAHAKGEQRNKTSKLEKFKAPKHKPRKLTFG